MASVSSSYDHVYEQEHVAVLESRQCTATARRN